MADETCPCCGQDKLRIIKDTPFFVVKKCDACGYKVTIDKPTA